MVGVMECLPSMISLSVCGFMWMDCAISLCEIAIGFKYSLSKISPAVILFFIGGCFISERLDYIERLPHSNQKLSGR